MTIKRYKEGPYDSLQIDDDGMYCMYEDIKHIAPNLKRYKFGHWGSVICCEDGYFVYYQDLVEAHEKK